jgi:hypothetical protein
MTRLGGYYSLARYDILPRWQRHRDNRLVSVFTRRSRVKWPTVIYILEGDDKDRVYLNILWHTDCFSWRGSLTGLRISERIVA